MDSHGIQCLVITGLITNGCVQATSIAGKELGYRVILIEDGRSSYIKGADKLIREWNRKLGAGVAELHPAFEIAFE